MFRKSHQSLKPHSDNDDIIWSLSSSAPVHVSPSETSTTIHCTAPNTKPPTHLLWRFNHSQIIVDQTGVDGPHRVSEQWRQQVEDVSASGSLTLHHLSSGHQGTFTCELRSEEETHFIHSYVTIEEGKIPWDENWLMKSSERLSDLRLVQWALGSPGGADPPGLCPPAHQEHHVHMLSGGHTGTSRTHTHTLHFTLKTYHCTLLMLQFYSLNYRFFRFSCTNCGRSTRCVCSIRSWSRILLL